MLIQKKIEIAVNDIISFKLVTGEELLAKLAAFDDSSITITKPVVAQTQMVSATQAGIVFSPFMSTADDEETKFRFDRSKIVCDPIKPRKDITNKYIEMTTGLTLIKK